MKRTRFLFAVIPVLLFATTITWAQVPEFPDPQQAHAWLQQFAGEWTSTSRTTALPGQPAMECTGTMKSRMLGGFWVINEVRGDMGGMTFDAIQTIGYNAAKKKYVGTWVDSMMDFLWHYEGDVDHTGTKLVLVAEGPNFMAPGKVARFRDSYQFKSPDLIVATAEMMDDDGNWVTFMTGEMKRNPRKPQ
jgi:hypothetical protein